MVRELEDAGIAVTNSAAVLDETCYLRFDGHFSAEGHRRVAALMSEVLESEYGL